MNKRNLIGNVLNRISIFLKLNNYKETIEGLDNLMYANSNFSTLTYMASHTDSRDILLLDKKVRKYLGNNKYPIFIMRDDLTLPITSAYELPLGVSQLLYGQCGVIKINQSDNKSLYSKKDSIKEVLEAGKSIVLFPGGTRQFGPVNGLTEIAVKGYTTMLKRLKFNESHAYLPVGMTFDNNNKIAIISFGKAIPYNPKTKPADLGIQVKNSLVELTGFNLENIVSADKVRYYIKQELRTSRIDS